MDAVCLQVVIFADEWGLLQIQMQVRYKCTVTELYKCQCNIQESNVVEVCKLKSKP